MSFVSDKEVFEEKGVKLEEAVEKLTPKPDAVGPVRPEVVEKRKNSKKGSLKHKKPPVPKNPRSNSFSFS